MIQDTKPGAGPADATTMAVFTGTVYDRGRLLEAASRARRRGRHKKALALYRRVLEVEPNNPDLERRVAPLLARTKKPDEAWKAYRKAAESLARRGFVDQAIGVYSEAKRYLPRQPELWRALADLELERRRKPDALATLLEGTRHLRRRAQRRDAIALLEHGRRIDRGHFATSYELAGLLLRDGARARAASLLAELARSARGSELRRVRLRQLRMAPTPAAFWRLLLSLVGVR